MGILCPIEMNAKKFYEEYWNVRQVDKAIRYRAERIASYIPPFARVLDVGGGDAILFDFLKGKKIDYLLMDISEEALRRADERGINSLQQDIEKPFKKMEPFDFVIVNEVFEHLFTPGDTLRECRSALNATGTIIASFPNESCLGTQMYKRKINSWEYPHIREFRGMQNIKKFMKSAKFHILRTEKIGAIPILHKFMPLSIVSKIGSCTPLFTSNIIVEAMKCL